MDTELINGFSDVMKHIRNQEKRIQELEKENEFYKKLYLEKYRDYEILEKKKESESYKTKVKQLIQQKHELEAKIDEAQVAFEENKLYKKEIDAIRKSVEEECQASGLMEVMNMRIEDAEKKAEEQERLRIIAETLVEQIQEEKKDLYNEINDLHSTLESLEYCQCPDCCEWKKLDEMEWVYTEYTTQDLVCLECRDENHTRCDECSEYHHNTNITNINDREVCSGCLTDEDD